MKVTDEMVERACRCAGWEPRQAKHTVRLALEAVLSDVPEPWEPELRKIQDRRRLNRIDKLEAKLDTVREWAECNLAVDLLEILDGEDK